VRVARIVGLAASVGRCPHEQVRVLAVLPVVPVPEQQLVVDPGLDLGLRALLVALDRIGQRSGVRPDIDRDHEALAVGEHLEAVDVARQPGDLLGLAAGRPDPPDLRRARAR